METKAPSLNRCPEPSSVYALWRARWSIPEADPDHTRLARAWSRDARRLSEEHPEGFRAYCRAVNRASARGFGRRGVPAGPWTPRVLVPVPLAPQAPAGGE
jgi:hypothetical protein